MLFSKPSLERSAGAARGAQDKWQIMCRAGIVNISTDEK